MKPLFDLFPAIVFFVAYAGFGKDIILATIALLAASAVQITLGWLLWRKVDRMHLVIFGVLAVFGGLTIVLHDETFIKWKPTIVDIIFAVVLLGGQFAGTRNLLQRMVEAIMKRAAPTMVIDAPKSTWTLVNASAILFFLGCAALNLHVAYTYDTDTWMIFKFFGLTALNFVFMIGIIIWLSRHAHTIDENADAVNTPLNANPSDNPPPAR